MQTKRVLSIGQCWADHSAISSVFKDSFDAEVVGADSAAEVLKQRDGTYDLVLVNRVLDGNGGSGVDVIRQLRADERFQKTPIMLVSNHDDAQREAMLAGAVRGFGKAALGHADMLARVEQYLQD